MQVARGCALACVINTLNLLFTASFALGSMAWNYHTPLTLLNDWLQQLLAPRLLNNALPYLLRHSITGTKMKTKHK
jgi:hypothetical protein